MRLAERVVMATASLNLIQVLANLLLVMLRMRSQAARPKVSLLRRTWLRVKAILGPVD